MPILWLQKVNLKVFEFYLDFAMNYFCLEKLEFIERRSKSQKILKPSIKVAWLFSVIFKHL